MQHLGSEIVDALRGKLDISYLDCVKAATCVMESLSDFLAKTQGIIDMGILRQLQMDVKDGQKALDAKRAKECIDYRTSVKMIDRLVGFRQGSDNFERMWPGGKYSAEENVELHENAASLLQRLRTIFNLGNPRILHEVIEYPGSGYADEFKVITVLADELLWLLQNNEYSHTTSYLASFDDICDILLHSISIHTYALDVICTNEVIRSCLFRICKKVLTSGTSNVVHDVECWRLLGKWMKLTTYVVSHLTKDPTFRPEFPDDRWTDEVFPDSSAFFEQFVPKLECLKTAAFSRLKEQFIALIVAFSCLHSDSARDCNEGILKYLNRFLSFAKTDDELLELIVYVVVGWWNHDGVGSVLDGTNVADDFGLQSSMKLISRFLVSLLDVKIISVDSGVKFFCASDTDLKEWEDGFYLIRDSDVVLLKEVCSRIMADCSEDEPVYQEAYLMEKHITQSARC